MLITRKAEFSASHVCRNPALSEEENRAAFGAAANPHGHGHNYVLEVTLEGDPDPVTGMVMDLKELKALLNRDGPRRGPGGTGSAGESRGAGRLRPSQSERRDPAIRGDRTHHGEPGAALRPAASRALAHGFPQGLAAPGKDSHRGNRAEHL